MKIVDAFIFYNELDLLYYRLSILYDIVDYFIIVESTRTFVGKYKPLYYIENKVMFSKFSDKIIHIIDDNLIENTNNAWDNEYHQRNYIDEGIKLLELSNNDKIMVSDLDEIPDPNVLIKIKEENQQFDILSFEQDFYYYNLTCKHSNKWYFSRIFSYNYYIDILDRKPQKCRSLGETKNISPGGWHLSYFGDTDFIRNKIEQFSHQEFNHEMYKNQHNIGENIRNCNDLFFRQGDSYRINRIPISENNYLPPQYDIYLKKYLG